MPELPHLPLIQLTSDLPRHRRLGHSDVIPREAREREEFRQKMADECDEIFSEFKDLQEEYKGSINPELIFRITLRGSVKANEIERLGLRVLSVVDKDAVIVFSSNRHFDDFKSKLDEYVLVLERRKHPFLDAFMDLKKIDPESKIGPLLNNSPLNENENALVDIEFWFLGDDRSSIKQMDSWSSELKNLIVNGSGE
ncbi:MAG: hypothetical protein ACE14P_10690 [Methanotrichaceae archaeon]